MIFKQKFVQPIADYNYVFTFAPRFAHGEIFREMAEWSIATVLKTVDCNRSGGSNPSLSAEYNNKTFKTLFKSFKQGFLFLVDAQNIQKRP
jgi:hypothetical protein